MNQSMEEEIWKDVPQYEGVYQVSNQGRVRSLDRAVNAKNGCVHHYKGRVLKESIRKDGFAEVGIGNRRRYIHRLVAEVFLDVNSIKGKYIVKHRNGIRIDNSLDNLKITRYHAKEKH